MPQELGLPVYLDAEAEKGTKIVVAGEYSGTTENPKFGGQDHHFFEIGKEGRHVVLSGGSLNYRADSGMLEEGKVYDVIWQGYEKMDKGRFAGKEAKQYDLAVYSSKEVEEILAESGRDLRKAPPAAVAAAPVIEDSRVASANETLEGLE